ncbi:Hsp70 family protein [Entamoeba marina]
MSIPTTTNNTSFILGIDIGDNGIKICKWLDGNKTPTSPKKYPFQCTYDKYLDFNKNRFLPNAKQIPVRNILGLKDCLGSRPCQNTRKFTTQCPNPKFDMGHLGQLSPVVVVKEFFEFHLFDYLKTEENESLSDIIPCIKSCVVSVPLDYSFSKRKDLADAFKLLGINKIIFLHDHVALSVCYQILKYSADSKVINGEIENDYKMFLDIGSSRTTCSVVEFKGSCITIMAVKVMNFGGNDFDEKLLDLIHTKLLALKEVESENEVFESYKKIINDQSKLNKFNFELTLKLDDLKKGFCGKNATEFEFKFEILGEEGEVTISEEEFKKCFDNEIELIKDVIQQQKAFVKDKSTKELCSCVLNGSQTRLQLFSQLVQSEGLNVVLFEPENSIAMGCCYIAKMEYDYVKQITNVNERDSQEPKPVEVIHYVPKGLFELNEQPFPAIDELTKTCKLHSNTKSTDINLSYMGELIVCKQQFGDKNGFGVSLDNFLYSGKRPLSQAIRDVVYPLIEVEVVEHESIVTKVLGGNENIALPYGNEAEKYEEEVEEVKKLKELYAIVTEVDKLKSSIKKDLVKAKKNKDLKKEAITLTKELNSISDVDIEACKALEEKVKKLMSPNN